VTERDLNILNIAGEDYARVSPVVYRPIKPGQGVDSRGKGEHGMDRLPLQSKRQSTTDLFFKMFVEDTVIRTIGFWGEGESREAERL